MWTGSCGWLSRCVQQLRGEIRPARHDVLVGLDPQRLPVPQVGHLGVLDLPAIARADQLVAVVLGAQIEVLVGDVGQLAEHGVGAAPAHHVRVVPAALHRQWQRLDLERLG
jgi:hypothetical protein